MKKQIPSERLRVKFRRMNSHALLRKIAKGGMDEKTAEIAAAVFSRRFE